MEFIDQTVHHSVDSLEGIFGPHTQKTEHEIDQIRNKLRKEEKVRIQGKLHNHKTKGHWHHVWLISSNGSFEIKVESKDPNVGSKTKGDELVFEGKLRVQGDLELYAATLIF